MEINVKINGESVKINIKEKLGYVDSISFVSSIIYGIIDEVSMTASFALKEYEIRCNTIQYYTDYKMPELSDKDAEDETKVEKYLEECHSIVFDTGLYDEILTIICVDQYNKLIEAVDNQLYFEVKSMQNSLKMQTETLINQFIQVSEALKVFDGIDMNQIAETLPQFMGNVDPNNPDFIKAIMDNQQKPKRQYNKKKKDPKDGSIIPVIKSQVSVDDVLNKDTGDDK